MSLGPRNSAVQGFDWFLIPLLYVFLTLTRVLSIVISSVIYRPCVGSCTIEENSQVYLAKLFIDAHETARYRFRKADSTPGERKMMDDSVVQVDMAERLITKIAQENPSVTTHVAIHRMSLAASKKLDDCIRDGLVRALMMQPKFYVDVCIQSVNRWGWLCQHSSYYFFTTMF